jgi:hypothetical protein
MNFENIPHVQERISEHRNSQWTVLSYTYALVFFLFFSNKFYYFTFFIYTVKIKYESTCRWVGVGQCLVCWCG